jgi:hypothetical protein
MGQEAGILGGVLRCSPGTDPGREECTAHLHPAMEGKGPLETQLGLASYIHESQRGVSPRQDIDEGTRAEGTRHEGAALQRGRPAVQFPGEQRFQDHQDHQRPERQGHLALQNRQVLLPPAAGLKIRVYISNMQGHRGGATYKVLGTCPGDSNPRGADLCEQRRHEALLDGLPHRGQVTHSTSS